MPSPVLPLHAQNTAPKAGLSVTVQTPLPTGSPRVRSAPAHTPVPHSAFTNRTSRSAFSARSAGAETLDVVIAELEESRREAAHLYDPDDELTDDESDETDHSWEHKVT